MFRILSLAITLTSLVTMSGCVLGPYGGGGHCNNCDGGVALGSADFGPGSRFRQWRRSLSCGAGCGETYYDEWYSTPPSCDNCDFGNPNGPRPGLGGGLAGGCLNQGCGAGSCSSCRVGIRPLRTVVGLAAGLYGRRFCNSCGDDVDNCVCAAAGAGGCDGGCGAQVIHGESAGGCANGQCSINHALPTATHTVQSNANVSPAYQQAMARQHQASGARQGVAGNQQVIRLNEPEQKFFRQATRLPQGQPAFRR